MRGLVLVVIVLLVFACNGDDEGPSTATPRPSPSATATATRTATSTPVATSTPLVDFQPVLLEEGASITEEGPYLVEVSTGRLWWLGDRGGRWSPDGRTLLSGGCCTEEGGLDLIEVPAGPAVRIFSGDIASAAWSPDGSQIVFSRYEDGPKGLYVINRDGGGLKQLSDMAGVWSSSWAPKGDRIAFKGPEHLYLLDVASGEIAEVADLVHGFAWSPDGSSLVFSNDRGLYLYEPDTGESRELASGYTGGPIHWSPDGSRVAVRLGPRIAMTYGAYAHDPQTGVQLVQVVEIFSVPAIQDYAEPKPLPPARNPSWSPDGSSIAYLSEGCITGNWDIFTIQPDGSSATPLTGTPEDVKEGPVWSPTGSAIAFSDFVKLMLVDAESGELRTLAVSGQPEARGPTIHLHGSDWSNFPWSPDGRYIAFHAGGDHGICD